MVDLEARKNHMGNEYARNVHVVLAMKGLRTEIWAAATPRSAALEAVQAMLDEGWKAVRIIESRLTRDRVASLKLHPNDVQKLTEAQ
jgi:hypothetical protein